MGVSPIENYGQVCFVMSLYNHVPNYKWGFLLDNRDRLVRDIFKPKNAEFGVFFNRMESGLEHLANILRLFLREENMGCMSFLMELFGAPNHTPDHTPSTTPPGDSRRDLQPEDISLEISRIPNTW